MSKIVGENILTNVEQYTDGTEFEEEIPPELSESIPTEELAYKEYQKKGIALIFNHFEFDDKTLPTREGTQKACVDIDSVATNLGFETIVHHDLTYASIKDALQEVSQRDHSDHTCLMVVVMSHGDDGVIHARDEPYLPQILWQPFVDEKCPSLSGKPKLFFIQACRGSKTDLGVRIQGDSSRVYKIPEIEDLLVMYSTYEGYKSYRTSLSGSWFIQSLCTELECAKDKDISILNVLTYVNNIMKYECEPDFPKKSEKKQIGCIVSTLRKEFYTG